MALGESFLEARTPDGVLAVPKADIYVGKSLLTYGEWCGLETKLFEQLLRPGAIVVDGGANLGATSLVLSRIVGAQGRVFAFELMPAMAQLLSYNMVSNGRENVEVIAAGLGEETSTVTTALQRLDRAFNYGGLNTQSFDAQEGKHGAIRAQIRALDDILHLDALALLKLDVEGAEPAALRGAAETIKRCQPALYLEVDQVAHTAPVLAELAVLGYRGWWHVSPLFRQGNPNGVEEDVFGQVTCVNMLCLPEDKDVEGLPIVDGVESHPKANRG